MARIFTALQNTVGGGGQGLAQGVMAGLDWAKEKRKADADDKYKTWQKDFATEQAGIAQVNTEETQRLARKKMELDERIQTNVELRGEVASGQVDTELAWRQKNEGDKFRLSARRLNVVQLKDESDRVFRDRVFEQEVEQWGVELDMKRGENESKWAYNDRVLAEKARTSRTQEAAVDRAQTEAERKSLVVEGLERERLEWQRETTAKDDEFKERRLNLDEDRNQHDMNMQIKAYASSEEAEKTRLALAERAQALDEEGQAWTEERAKGLDALEKERLNADIAYQGVMGAAATTRAGAADRASRVSETVLLENQAADEMLAEAALDGAGIEETDDNINDPLSTHAVDQDTGIEVRVEEDANGNLIEVDPITGDPVIDPATGKPKVVTPAGLPD